MIAITGTVEGEQQVNRSFSRLISLSSDFSPLFVKEGEDLRDIEKEQFDAQGYGWAPLSAAYGAWKQFHFPNKTILRRSDRLYRSITQLQGEDNITEIHPTYALFGAGPPSGVYGRFHQLGTSMMPRRKVFDLREVDKRQMTKTFHVYAVTLGREAGFGIV